MIPRKVASDVAFFNQSVVISRFHSKNCIPIASTCQVEWSEVCCYNLEALMSSAKVETHRGGYLSPKKSHHVMTTVASLFTPSLLPTFCHLLPISL